MNVKVLIAKSCQTLETKVYRLSGSSVHGILQARILEGVAFPSPGDLSNESASLVYPALAGGFFTLML